MGTLVGHLAPGVVLFFHGLWQLFNHIRLFLLRPGSYVAPVWFPVRGPRYLELVWLILAAVVDLLAELVVNPARHHPLDGDGSIPSSHLNSFEHTTVSLAMLLFAAVAIAVDRARPRPPARRAVALLAAASWSAQELLLFHFHSADHMGVEGHFHLLLQTAAAVTLAATLLQVARPRSVAVSLVRSASLVFQGVWFAATGVTLWTPALVPKGCFLNDEGGSRQVVRCRTGEALHRAKSLANLQFGWYLSATMVLVVALYLRMAKLYPEEQRYVPVVKEGSRSSGDCDGRSFNIGDDDDTEDGDDDDDDDVEAAKRGFGHMLSGTKPIEIDW